VGVGFKNHKVIKPYYISYMQRGESMAKIVKYVYFMIIFISPFVVANQESKPLFIFQKFS